MDAGITEDKTMEKKSLVCRLVKRSELTGGVALLKFDWGGPKPDAGQFFLVRPEDATVFLARPLSVANFSEDELSGRHVYFLAAKRGKGMEELLAMRIGEKARLTGPLGNRWADFLTKKSSADSANKDGGQPVLVAGGIGIAPIAFLYREHLLRSIVLFLAGFRSGGEGLAILDALDIDKNVLTLVSEDGTSGESGLVTDYLKAREFAAVYVCGPGPMMRTVAALCRSADVPCFVSLEEHMACGAGACLGCSVPTVSGNKRCCSDGPIFNAEEVFFDEL
jgi:NAD(P)H-flavin reductase